MLDCVLEVKKNVRNLFFVPCIISYVWSLGNVSFED